MYRRKPPHAVVKHGSLSSLFLFVFFLSNLVTAATPPATAVNPAFERVLFVGGHAVSASSSEALAYAVAVDGDVAVVGAPWHEGFRGAAYVYERRGGSWERVQTLDAEGVGRWDHFGESVAIVGGDVIVSAPWHDLMRGAAWVFTRGSDGTWAERQTLTVAGAEPESGSGRIDGVADGALLLNAGGNGESVRLVKSGGAWIETGRITTPSVSMSLSQAAVITPDLAESLDATLGETPALAAAPDPVSFLQATDGAFETHTELTWGNTGASAIVYKIRRDGALISIASSDASAYVDAAGTRGAVHTYCVTVSDLIGGESAPVCDAGSRIVFGPENLTATDGLFDGFVRVAWEDRSAVEDAFEVYRDNALIATVASNIQSYDDAVGDAGPGAGHTYSVRALDADAHASASSNPDTGFRGTMMPPGNVQASDGEFGAGVKVTWVDQSADETGFVVTRAAVGGGSPPVEIATTDPNVAEYLDPTAAPGTVYDYCVRAIAAGKESVPVCDNGTVDLPAPTGVTASDGTFDDRVHVGWQDAGSLESGFEVLRGATLLATLPANSTSYSDTGAEPGVTATYFVRAVNDSGGVSMSVGDPGTRAIVLAPTNVQATDGNQEDRVTVTWESSSTTALLFNLYRGATFIKSVDNGTFVYEDFGGAANQPHVYSVQAVTVHAGNQVTSSAAIDNGHRALEPPTNVMATDDAHEDKVIITWADNSLEEVGFRVMRRDTTAGSPEVLVGSPEKNETSFIDFTGVPGVTYRYAVAAYDTTGGLGESTRDDDLGRRTLGAPSGVVATDGQYEEKVVIDWTDNSTAEDSFLVYRGAQRIGAVADNVTTFEDMSPSVNVPATYRVIAADAWGQSDESTDTGFAGILAPSSFNASDTYTNQIVLTWVDVSNIETGYRLERNGALLANLAANTTSYADNSNGGTYTLYAVNGAQQSPPATDTGKLGQQVVVGTPVIKLDPTLLPEDSNEGFFGFSMDVSGNWVIIGDPGNRRAYIYEYTGSDTWALRDILNGPNGVDNFGFDVAIDVYGTLGLAIVSAPTLSGGNVYLYERNASTGVWIPESGEFDANGGDELGHSVDLVILRYTPTGELNGGPSAFAAVGVPGDDTAYLIERDREGQWDEVVAENGEPDPPYLILKGNTGDGDRFGEDVVLTSEPQYGVETLFVGAPETGGNQDGAVYVFYRQDDGQQQNGSDFWPLVQRIDGNGPVGRFGSVIAASDRGSTTDWLFIGKPIDDGGFGLGDGSVDAYSRLNEGTTTTPFSFSSSLEPDGYDGGFGNSLSLFDTDAARHLLVGDAGLRNGVVTSSHNAAHLFEKVGSGAWTEVVRYEPEEDRGSVAFGQAVAVTDRFAMIGQPDPRYQLDTSEVVGDGAVFAHDFNFVPAPLISNIRASDGDYSTRVRVEWDDNTSEEVAFHIFRDGQFIEEVGPNTRQYNDVEAVPGRTYEYCVSAMAGDGSVLDNGCDYGWRQPDGNITGRISTPAGAPVEGAEVCLVPPPSRSVLLDGVGGQVRFPNADALDVAGTQSVTFELWVRFGSQSAGMIPIFKRGTTGARYMLETITSSGGGADPGEMRFTMSDGAATVLVRSTIDGLHNNAWHHVACVKNAAAKTLTIFVDGALQGTTNYASLGDVAPDADLVLGAGFKGQADEFQVWDLARTGTEIAQTRNSALTGDEALLRHYWPFDEHAGTATTDMAPTGLYGLREGGAYPSDHTAIAFCGVTDDEGNFTIGNIRYDEETTFNVTPLPNGKEFSPAFSSITLNTGHPVENQVHFAETTSLTIGGEIVSTEGCRFPGVEIMVDGETRGITDKNGKFAISLPRGQHTVKPKFSDHTFAPVERTYALTADVLNANFTNTTTRTVTGIVVGGGCNFDIGVATVRFRSEDGCLSKTVQTSGTHFTTQLPPGKYALDVTAVADTPAGLFQDEVLDYFRSIGKQFVDVTNEDGATEFRYRAPIVIEPLVPSEDFELCATLMYGAQPLAPALIIPQLRSVTLDILVSENYGPELGTCPVDSGVVTVYDEISARENTPVVLEVKNGIATYQSSAVSPNFIVGRRDSQNANRSFQKKLTAVARVEGGRSTTREMWALVTGHLGKEGVEFVSATTDEIPLMLLRDPPGDTSYAALERGYTSQSTIDFNIFTNGGAGGVRTEFKYGLDETFFIGISVGKIHNIKQVFVANASLLAGQTASQDGRTTVTMTTQQRFATSNSNDFVGQGGDVYVGAAMNYLFGEIDELEISREGDVCNVLRSTGMAFQPDSISTFFTFTDEHIREVQMPRLERLVDYYTNTKVEADSAAFFQAQFNNWQKMVDRNETLKRSAETVTNRTFSAGADYEYTVSTDTTRSFTEEVRFTFDSEAAVGYEWALGSEGSILAQGEFHHENVTSLTDSAGTATRTVTYVLSDDDAGDEFTVDIKKDGEYPNPVFDVRAGNSSCPYEPWPDDKGKSRMVPRDKPVLMARTPQESNNVPADKPFAFIVEIANDSPTHETREYILQLLSESNPNGAIVKLGGQPLIEGASFIVSPGQSHMATISVEPGPVAAVYDSLLLVLYPECEGVGSGGGRRFQPGPAVARSDSLRFSVRFAAPCTDITLAEPVSGWRYNSVNRAAGDPIPLALKNYIVTLSNSNPDDAEATTISEIGVEYRRLGVGNQGPTPWEEVPLVFPIDQLAPDELPRPLRTDVEWVPNNLIDGRYEFRAYANCPAGRSYSLMSEGTVDLTVPGVTFSPADGELSRGEVISARFSETIDCATATEDSITLYFASGDNAGQSVPVKRTCNGTTYVLTPDDPASIEGQVLLLRVRGVRDLFGNPLAPAFTTFVARNSRFVWSSSTLEQSVPFGVPTSVTNNLVNGTQLPVTFALSQLPPWVLGATPDSGTLQPGGVQPVTFTIDPNLVESTTPYTAQILAAVPGGQIAGTSFELNVTVGCVPPTWNVDPSRYEHVMNVVTRLKIDDTFSVDPNDRIAAFVGYELRGSANLQQVKVGNNTTYQAFLQVYSNRIAGEVVRFEVFDASECVRYNATLERITFEANRSTGTPAIPSVLTAVMDLPQSVQVIPVSEGWTWFSTNIVSSDMSVAGIFQQLNLSDGDFIKSRTQSAIYDSEIGWTGTLTDLDNTSAYRVRLADPGMLFREGTLADPAQTPITVQQGENWIAFVPAQPLTVSDALAGLAPKLSTGDIIRGQEGFAQYVASTTKQWFGNLTAMKPGQGYELVLANNGIAQFNYPGVTTTLAGREPMNDPLGTEAADGPGWRLRSGDFRNSMTAVVSVAIGAGEWRSDNFLVAAFVGDECRGFAKPVRVAGLGHHVALLMIHGNAIEGEKVHFEVYDQKTSAVYTVDEQIVFEADVVQGSVRDPVLLSTGRVVRTGGDRVPATFALDQNYPNPFNPVTTIRFQVPQAARVDIRVYDVRGQEILKLLDTNYPVGTHEVQWDGRDRTGTPVASGIYFYKMRAGSFNSVRKMVLLK